MGWILDVAIKAQMVAQCVTDHPFNHAFGQGGVYHAAQGLGQGGIANDPFNTGPKAKHGFAARIGREILQRAGGGVYDVIDLSRTRGLRKICGYFCLCERGLQRGAVFIPDGWGGKKDGQGHAQAPVRL